MGKMPNQPSTRTVTVSFTMPKVLAGQIDRLAKRQMTNKSEIIRRALMEYLPTEMRATVADAIVADEEAGSYGSEK